MTQFRPTDEEIQRLILSTKYIVDKIPAREFREEHNHKRCRLVLATEMAAAEKPFEIFINQHNDFVENFSIGLRYKTNDAQLGTITLIRYNGAHGLDARTADGHFTSPHIHSISAADILAGRSEPQRVEITHKYTKFKEAMLAFFRDLGVNNYLEYFPDIQQREFL